VRRRNRFLFLVVLLTLAGCAGRLSPPAGGPGAPAAAAAVERFLQLAAEKDYLQMGWVFGTSDGAVLEDWPPPEVEQRMYGLATLLQHDSFVLGSGSPVPGRVGEAIACRARLSRGTSRFDVPMVAVRGPGGRWFVETVDVQSVTNVR